MPGWPGRPLRLLLLGLGGVPPVDHTDDLDPVAILHCLQGRLDMTILIRHRGNKMRVQEGAIDSDLLLGHLINRDFSFMQCFNGVAVGRNGEVMEVMI